MNVRYRTASPTHRRGSRGGRARALLVPPALVVSALAWSAAVVTNVMGLGAVAQHLLLGHGPGLPATVRDQLVLVGRTAVVAVVAASGSLIWCGQLMAAWMMALRGSARARRLLAFAIPVAFGVDLWVPATGLDVEGVTVALLNGLFVLVATELMHRRGPSLYLERSAHIRARSTVTDDDLDLCVLAYLCSAFAVTFTVAYLAVFLAVAGSL